MKETPATMQRGSDALNPPRPLFPELAVLPGLRLLPLFL